MPVTGSKMRSISPARRAAFEALDQVETGAYASDCLLSLGQPLSSRDAALANTLVFGTLRYRAQLDHLIQTYSRRRAETLDAPLLTSLRVGIFQLRYLDRIPAHAAVNESVERVKQKSRAAAGLANAVLRKVNRDPVRWPDEATELSCPGWLLESWTRQFGKEVARSIAEAALREPQQYFRLVADTGALPAMQATSVEGCFRVMEEVPGDVRLQDIGSQTVVPLLDLRPGQTYLDLCAAPGNKTAQALETELGLAIACDVSYTRLRQVPPICPRVVLDATRPLPFKRPFDRVFVDAPCSGTGTLARNPEIKWRLKKDDLARFSERQAAMLEQALQAVNPGGRLLYATCSLESEENEQVVRKVLDRFPEYSLADEKWRLPGRDEGDGFYSAAILRRA